jgi:DmsE family decaheme c-type cytochrome
VSRGYCSVGERGPRPRRFPGLGVLVAALLLISGSALAAEAGRRVPEANYTDAGAEGCLRCHGGERMVVIADTPHGNSDNPHTPFAQTGCEACHGPGSLHVSRARGGAGFPPLLRFGRGGDPVAAQLDACLGCHEQDLGELPGMAWRGALHDTGRMTCSSCHQLHARENVLSDPEQQKAACATCHSDQIANHKRFEGKGILFDRLTCHDCHDVHQLIGDR